MRNLATGFLVSAITIVIVFYWNWGSPSNDRNGGGAETNIPPIGAPGAIERAVTPAWPASKPLWAKNPFRKATTADINDMSNFKSPDLNWPSRSLSGALYVFGQGDPPSVKPKAEDYGNAQEFYHDLSVKPDTERELYAFLSNPFLPALINKCGKLVSPGQSAPESTVSSDLPSALFDVDFSMGKMLYVDPANGRKKIDWNRYTALGDALTQIRNFDISGNKVNLLADRCLSASEIKDFDLLYQQYLDVGLSYSNESLMGTGT
ncbi:MAG: hypothetical protein V4582_23550 [Pseudomonadota bacterium]